jgi:general secretion pathway protein B
VSEKPAAPPAPPRTAAAVPEKPAAPPAATAPTKPAERTGGPLLALQDMSAAEQEGMPKMALQVLVYSEVPAERMIFINNQKYIEGQSIEGKVAVESIVPDGAILNYQGKRFKLRH